MMSRPLPQAHIKQKQNRQLDIKKKFHFDPRSQQILSRPLTKQKSIQIIIKDQNYQFSSVKEQNDFNDSSWLAKLVNGLQQDQHFGVKPVGDISNLISGTNSQINHKFSTLQTNLINQLKHSNQKQKSNIRKSVPIIPRYQKNNKQYHKLNYQQSLLNKNNEKDKHVKSISYDPNKINNNKNKYTNQRKFSLSSQKQLNPKFPCQNQPKKQTQKNEPYENEANKQDKQNKQQNSISQNNQNNIKNNENKQLTKSFELAYNIIKQQSQQSPPLKNQLQQPIIVDLDQITLKHQQPILKPTPLSQKNQNVIIQQSCKNKNKDKGPTHLNKQNKDKSNKIKIDKLTLHYKQKYHVSNKQNEPQTISKNAHLIKQHHEFKLLTQITPVTTINSHRNPKTPQIKHPPTHKQQKLKIQIPHPQLIQTNLQNNPTLSSHNQFLDTFKQQLPLLIQSSLTQQTSNAITNLQQNFNKSPTSMSQISQSNNKVGSIKKNHLPKIPHSQKQDQMSKKSINNIIQNQYHQIPTFTQRPSQLQPQLSQQPILTDRLKQRQNSLHLIGSTPPQFPCIRKNSSRQLNPSTSRKKTIQTRVQQIKLNFQDTIQLKQSPKFNYCFNQQLIHKQFQSPSQHKHNKLKYQQIYYKLNSNNQAHLHKYNCQQNLLNITQKYQIGTLLSKIKYLNYTYTQNQFINQCLKIQTKSKQPNNTHQNNSNKFAIQKSIKTNQNKSISSTNKIIKNQPNSKNTYKLRSLTQKKSTQQKILTQQPISHPQQNKPTQKYQYTLSQLQPNSQYLPLFPQSLSTYTQTYSLQKNIKQRTDLGTIIDNLNNKLSNYIQNNNLQDTYRKFKLEFVQLRRNMLY